MIEPAAHSRPRSGPAWSGLLLALFLLAAFGAGVSCRRADAPSAGLHARDVSSRDPNLQEIHVAVAASPEGLRYQWFADHGECDPQRSTEPSTLFRFADEHPIDRVTVDVWRGSTRIAQQTLEVTRRVTPPAEALRLKITIDRPAPFAPGGPNTRADIAGYVEGLTDPGARVLVYARDEGVWYLQPTALAKHDIGPDGRWSTWTHTGHAYAALVVAPDHRPLRTLDTIPPVRDSILARVVIDGPAR